MYKLLSKYVGYRMPIQVTMYLNEIICYIQFQRKLRNLCEYFKSWLCQ